VSAPPQLSPDGRSWWDGSAWRQVSSDRRSWWDGASWQPLPGAATPQITPLQFSPDGRFQWNGQQWIPANVPRSGGWWWNGWQWVPRQSPVGRAFTRLGVNLAFALIGCLLFGAFFAAAVVIAFHSLAH
jgi:hypothetical protein